MADINATISQGDWVLITGATGFLASHTARLFLDRGYKVRGTVRDLEKASWLVQDVFKDEAANGHFELALVPDMATPENPFISAVKGVSAIVHIATIGFDPDPHNSIPQAVRGLNHLLDLAAREPAVKQFVYTGSHNASVMPAADGHITRDSYNDLAVQMAWSPPPYDNEGRLFINYMASKVESEKALWNFVEEKKPHFQVNSVSPSMLLGEPLNKKHLEYDYATIKVLFDGRKELLAFPAVVHVDVKDAALVHVAAVLDPAVENQRLQVWGTLCNFNDMLAIMRKQYPGEKFMEDLPGQTQLQLTTDLSLQLELIKRWGQQDGFRTLEQSISENMEGIMKWKQ